VPVTAFGIAVSILVPWNDTNRSHRLRLRVEDEDSREVAGFEAQFEVGRPPGIPSGSDQRMVMAVNLHTQFPHAGGWRVVAEMGGEPRSASFRVHDEAAPGAPTIHPG